MMSLIAHQEGAGKIAVFSGSTTLLNIFVTIIYRNRNFLFQQKEYEIRRIWKIQDAFGKEGQRKLDSEESALNTACL